MAPAPRKRSKIWKLFISNGTNTNAQCNICGNVVTTNGGSTGNLNRHARAKHPAAWIACGQQQPDFVTCGKAAAAELEEDTAYEVVDEKPVAAAAAADEVRHFRILKVQQKQTASSARAVAAAAGGGGAADAPSARDDPLDETTTTTAAPAVKREKKPDKSALLAALPKKSLNKLTLDNALLEFIVRDFQSFAIVEQRSFQQLVHKLNPAYALPTRKSLANALASEAYAELVDQLKAELGETEAVCITTEAWTTATAAAPHTGDTYVAVMCHYVDPRRAAIRSVLLHCFCIGSEGQQQQTNIAEQLNAVLEEWRVQEKVVAFVTDKAADRVATVFDETNKAHIPCFVHALNGAVLDALGSVSVLREKVDRIGAHFRRCPAAASALVLAQLENGAGGRDGALLTLKRSTPGRWNSTLRMFKRVLEIKDDLRAVLDVLELPAALAPLSDNDYIAIGKTCELLEVFEEATAELSSGTSADRTVTVSKLLLIIDGIKENLSGFSVAGEEEDAEADAANNRVATMLSGLDAMVATLREHFFGWTVSGYETNSIIAEATLLDPRFKRYGIPNDELYHTTEAAIISLAASVAIKSTKTRSSDDPIASPSSSFASSASKRPKLFGKFDDKIRDLVQADEDPRIVATLEVTQYLQEPLLARSGNPIEWWNQRQECYPRLYGWALARLCVMVASVPSERLCTKAGQLLAERQCRLTGGKVEQIVFLHYNM